MANIQDKETHFTYHSKIGNIGDSFFYFTYWYKDSYVLITLVQGRTPAKHAQWLDYLNARGIRHELIGGACLILPESVEQVFIEERTFLGMNEIYILHKKPAGENVPAASYTPDAVEFGEEVPGSFLEGLRALDALAYLSDGKGVNIAHKLKEEIIYFVREMSV